MKDLKKLGFLVFIVLFGMTIVSCGDRDTRWDYGNEESSSSSSSVVANNYNNNAEYSEDVFAAISAGNLEKVKGIVSQNSSALKQKNSEDYTPLIFATEVGNYDIVKYLISAGADVNAIGQYGWNALMRASYYGNFEIAFLLIDSGADVNSVDNYEWTILMYATYYGQTDLTKKLVQKGAKLETTKPSDGTTALMWAAGNGHLETVKALVNAGAKINTEDKTGYTALDKAKMGGHSAVVSYLEGLGAVGNYDGGGDYYGDDDHYYGDDDDDDDDNFDGEYEGAAEEFTGEY